MPEVVWIEERSIDLQVVLDLFGLPRGLTEGVDGQEGVPRADGVAADGLEAPLGTGVAVFRTRAMMRVGDHDYDDGDDDDDFLMKMMISNNHDVINVVSNPIFPSDCNLFEIINPPVLFLW